MYCGHCGSEIPAASPFCRTCGAPTEHNRDVVADTPEGEMYPLLAAANLLRIRRQWEEATAKCIEVLRKYPNNASAHSLLGDICRDQSLLRDAAEWYKLALELDPSSRSDRIKLDRLADALYQNGESKPLPAAPKDLAAGFPLKRILREWLDAAQLNRPVGVGMAIAAVVLAMALLGVLAVQRTAPPPMGGSFEIPLHRRQTRAAVQPAARPAPTAPAPTPAPAQVPAEYGRREAAILAQVRQAAAGAPVPFTVEWVAIDPRDNSLALTLGLPAEHDQQATRNSVMTACASALQAAQRTDSQLTAYEVRVLLTAAPQEGAALPAELAYIGTTPANRLSGLSGERSPEQLEAVFTDSWWHPSLRPSPAP